VLLFALLVEVACAVADYIMADNNVLPASIGSVGVFDIIYKTEVLGALGYVFS
jgi:hypothetical protein